MIIFGSKCKTEIIPLSNIKASVNNVNTDRYIYLRSRIITCDEANGNGDFLPREEVIKIRQYNDATKEAYKSFVGKIVDYNHDTNIVIGKIIAVEFIENKEGKDYVDIICSIDKKCPAGGSTADQNFYNRIISRIENNELNQMSMEAFAENAECPYCKSKFPFAEPCEDIRNYMNAKIKAADGSEFFIYRIDRDLTFVGAGMVENPADKNAIVTNIIAKEILKNYEFYEIENEDSKDKIKEVIDELDEYPMKIQVWQINKDEEDIDKLPKNEKEHILETNGDGVYYAIKGDYIEIYKNEKAKEPMINEKYKSRKAAHKGLEKYLGVNLWTAWSMVSEDDKFYPLKEVSNSKDVKESKKTAKEVMSNMTALEFVKVIEALDNSDKNNELIAKLIEEIKEPIFEKELGQYITQRMTSMEIKNIKTKLIKAGKLIEQSLNAHIIDLNNIKYWLVMKNGIPLFKQSIQGIWGELLEKPVEKLEEDEKLEGGMSYKEYAISDIFKRRLLATIQTKGEEYLMSIWYGNEKFIASTKSISEVFGFKANINKEKIEASSEKDKFNSCINANLENNKIKAEDGQTREDAVVAYCFNDVMGIHASMSLEEIYKKDLEANEDILGGKENFKVWLQYKETGKWPTTIAAQLRIKIFANAVLKLDNENKEHLIKASNLLKYGFDNTDLQKYNVLIAEKDIEKLLKYGMEIKDIKELYNKRFGF
jgi:hypothetical protein